MCYTRKLQQVSIAIKKIKGYPKGIQQEILKKTHETHLNTVENKIGETHYLVVSYEHFKIRNGDTAFTQNSIEGTTHI